MDAQGHGHYESLTIDDLDARTFVPDQAIGTGIVSFRNLSGHSAPPYYFAGMIITLKSMAGQEILSPQNERS